MDFELLSKPLFQLMPSELEGIKAVADTLFTRLCRPLQLVSERTQFSTKKTIRTAMRIGEFLPQYEKVSRPNSKSRLVIAMSLSGVDRCYAVGLIPLLFQLKNTLDFKFFIYTDNLIPAVFTEDGFLENDIDIAWNNSNWVNMLHQLGQIEFDKQEDHLLIIDSLGSGGDSYFYKDWSISDAKEVAAAQEEYLTNDWKATRAYINGDFSKISKETMPHTWDSLVERNCSSRWLEAPSMKLYLMRWLLHPQFGRVNQGRSYERAYTLSHVVDGVRNKFASIHLLTPSCTEITRRNLNSLRYYDFIDFHHETDTLEGVAKVFTNIVYRRETKRLRVPNITFGRYTENVTTNVEDGESEFEHSNLLKGSKCFSKLPDLNMMPETSFTVDKRKRGNDTITTEQVPFNELDGSGCFSIISHHLPSIELKSHWSTFSKEEAMKEWFNDILKYELYSSFYQPSDKPRPEHIEVSYNLRTRKKCDSTLLDNWVESIELNKHHTRMAKPFIRELLEVYAPCYFPYMEKIPLKHVLFCNRGVFNPDKLAIALEPTTDRDEQQATIWHEFAHYVNFVCPAINVFTNEILRVRTGTNGTSDISKMIPLGQGEYALQPTKDYPPWITPYTGKYYKRIHRNLCNETELMPCYLPSFRGISHLVSLYELDKKMLQFVAFVICGGPLAVLEAYVHRKKKKAMIELQHYKDAVIDSINVIQKKRGRPAGSGKKSTTSTTTSKPTPTPESKNYSFGL